MTDITVQDWNDYNEGRGEIRERPAEPGDYRFDIGPMDEDGYQTVLMIDDKGVVVSRDYTTDPYGMVEAFREYQAMPDMEERLEYYRSRGIGE
jgi:hypothetical protein